MGRKAVSGSKGRMGRLFLGGNVFCAEDWDIQQVGVEEDTTNTCGAGNAEQEVGVTWLEGSINYTWDVSANYFSEAPMMNVGTKHAATKLYLHSEAGDGLQDGPFFDLTLHILNHQINVAVKGKVAGTITFKSHGAYTLPTGTDSSGA